MCAGAGWLYVCIHMLRCADVLIILFCVGTDTTNCRLPVRLLTGLMVGLVDWGYLRCTHVCIRDVKQQCLRVVACNITCEHRTARLSLCCDVVLC